MSAQRQHEAECAAREIVTALVAGGVRDVVLCPGSRSAPLAYALAAAEDAGWLDLHVRVDERVAGFLALGLSLGRRFLPWSGVEPVPEGPEGLAGPEGPAGPDGFTGTGTPDREPRAAAVVTTSGTAVANLHPAVLEASHSRVPLVVVSADRPHEMRGTGANQTTDQVGLFGSAVRGALDVPAGMPRLGAQVTRLLAAAHGTRATTPGPVQLNVALRDPLLPAADWNPGALPARSGVLRAAARPPATVELPAGGRTVLVAGDRAGAGAAGLARRGAWPLLAEPSSGARHDAGAVAAYRLLLEARAPQVERVVLLGHPTLSRPVSALLARADVEVVVVDPYAPWTDVAGTAARVADAVRVAGEPSADDHAWARAWREDGRRLAAALAAREDDAASVARAVWEGTAADVPLVLGSSSGVRDLDLAAGPATGPRRVLANRGLAGIDGTLATASGLALAGGRPVRALVGDLTFLHDAGALAVGDLERDPDLQVVVADDHGGGIFSTLEYGAAEDPALSRGPRAEAARLWAGATAAQRRYERLFGTPQDVDLIALARAYGAEARAVAPADLPAALAAPIAGRSVLVVRIDRGARRRGAEEAERAARERP